MTPLEFHLGLLGRDQLVTPERYRLSPLAEQLYSSGLNGVMAPMSWETTLPALVLALHLTRGEGKKVYVLTTQEGIGSTVEAVRELARHIFSIRKGNIEAVKVLKTALASLIITHQLQLLPEPPLWVILGRTSESDLPKWVVGKLLQPQSIAQSP